MPRTKLIEAREAADLSQGELAELIGAERKAVNGWERGTISPRTSYRRAIRRELDNDDPDLFKNFDTEANGDILEPGEPYHFDKSEHLPNEQQMLITCQTEPKSDNLNSSGTPPFVIHIPGSDKELLDMDKVRRAVTNAIGTTLLGVNLQIITTPPISSEGSTGPVIEPSEHLAQSSILIDSCWEWLNQGNFRQVERSLQRTMPTLAKLATSVWPRQGAAASLAVQAKIMEIILAKRELDFVGCELHGGEAVRFGRLSGNPIALATALDWQGNTYIYCYRQPQTAIPMFNDALASIGSDAPLNRSSIYSNLSIAHAQHGDEAKARDYIELAWATMPQSPEQAPFYQCVRLGTSELEQFEGRTYLILAEHFPHHGYAQKAYSAFEKSTSKKAINRTSLGVAMIRRADAARQLDEMGDFIDCLTNGVRIAIENRSKNRINEAYEVMGRIPAEWQKESAIQNLQKDISQALVVARR
jgi:transcriptional regulator with XRE-family HTH domain